MFGKKTQEHSSQSVVSLRFKSKFSGGLTANLAAVFWIKKNLMQPQFSAPNSKPHLMSFLLLLPSPMIEEGHGGVAWLLVPPPGWG